jgi:Uma2 family endonuclease
MDSDQVPEKTGRPLVMNRAAFYEWAEAQPSGRFERVNGEVVRMSPERWQHARLKAEIWRFIDAILIKRPGYRALIDGLAVTIDDETDYIPDVAIHQGGPISRNSLAIPNPVVVIEVLSRSTMRIDTTFKAEDYLRTPSIVHYLLFCADRRQVTLISRDNLVRQSFIRGASIAIDPPGIVLDVDAIYDRAEAS